MCTAATYCNGNFYFGRNLDYEFSYGEHVTITPRNYQIRLHGGALDRHYAMIGMAHIQNDYPLYYDAVNEKGLCIAGLNFVGNAVYPPVTQGVASVPQYALIPWLLGVPLDPLRKWPAIIIISSELPLAIYFFFFTVPESGTGDRLPAWTVKRKNKKH